MRIIHALLLSAVLSASAAPAIAKFTLEEATIDGIHAGIKAGEVTCTKIVEAYINRARAYNGVCTKPVTADGGNIPAALGAVRSGSPLKFPTETVALNKIV